MDKREFLKLSGLSAASLLTGSFSLAAPKKSAFIEKTIKVNAPPLPDFTLDDCYYLAVDLVIHNPMMIGLGHENTFLMPGKTGEYDHVQTMLWLFDKNTPREETCIMQQHGEKLWSPNYYNYFKNEQGEEKRALKAFWHWHDNGKGDWLNYSGLVVSGPMAYDKTKTITPYLIYPDQETGLLRWLLISANV